MESNEGQVGKQCKRENKRKRNTYNICIPLLMLNSSLLFSLQEWEAKAAKAKDDYDRAVKDFEANGGSSAANGSAKKRSKPAKKPAKKSKKEDSDDDDDDESEQT